jgi:hypothetical protein
MDSAKYLEIITQKDGILASIKSKMPWLQGKHVIVQHDGAPPHIGKGNGKALEALRYDGEWDIEFVSQPSQSPDLNILDLGFFNSLKKRIASEYALAKTTKDLMDAVLQAYEKYDRETLERIWGHQYAVYRMVLNYYGCNDFKAPHSDVRKNQRAGNGLSLAMNIKPKVMSKVKELVEEWQIKEDERLVNKNKKNLKKK